MKRSRSVSFAKKTLVIHHISIDDMTDEEIDATWVTPEEKKAYQADVVRNLRYMRQRPEAVTEQNGLCERGLEHLRSQASMKTRSMIKKKVVDAVLDEQDYQFDNDLCNDLTIRKAAIHISKISTERALSLAQLDAEYVRDTTSISCPPTTIDSKVVKKKQREHEEDQCPNQNYQHEKNCPFAGTILYNGSVITHPMLILITSEELEVIIDIGILTV